jgi:hypothetical protein
VEDLLQEDLEIGAFHLVGESEEDVNVTIMSITSDTVRTCTL